MFISQILFAVVTLLLVNHLSWFFCLFVFLLSWSMTGLKTFDHFGLTAKPIRQHQRWSEIDQRDQRWEWKTLSTYPHSLAPLLHHHVYTQSRKRGLQWGTPWAWVPFLPSRHGPWSSVNWQPSAKPRLIFTWCSLVSTNGLPSRLWELESWWTGAAGQTGGAEQVRAVLTVNL